MINSWKQMMQRMMAEMSQSEEMMLPKICTIHNRVQGVNAPIQIVSVEQKYSYTSLKFWMKLSNEPYFIAIMYNIGMMMSSIESDQSKEETFG